MNNFLRRVKIKPKHNSIFSKGEEREGALVETGASKPEDGDFQICVTVFFYEKLRSDKIKLIK